jgi:hypothetical protein
MPCESTSRVKEMSVEQTACCLVYQSLKDHAVMEVMEKPRACHHIIPITAKKRPDNTRPTSPLMRKRGKGTVPLNANQLKEVWPPKNQKAC